jgi:hypothetical protein
MPGQSATLTGNVFEARPKTAFQFFDPPQGEPVPLTAEPEEDPARRSISPTSSPSIPSSEAELRGRGRQRRLGGDARLRGTLAAGPGTSQRRNGRPCTSSRYPILATFRYPVARMGLFVSFSVSQPSCSPIPRPFMGIP